jgi:hypothetical protein
MNRTQFPNKAAQPMPGQVKGALAKRNLLATFQERPQYQQDDYLKWIALAAGPQQKQARMDQMLEELEKGGIFKGEPWTAPAKTEPVKADSGNGAGATTGAAKPQTAKAQPAKAAPSKTAAAKPASSKPAAAKPAPAKAGSSKAGASKTAAKKK